MKPVVPTDWVVCVSRGTNGSLRPVICHQPCLVSDCGETKGGIPGLIISTTLTRPWHFIVCLTQRDNSSVKCDLTWHASHHYQVSAPGAIVQHPITSPGSSVTPWPRREPPSVSPRTPRLHNVTKLHKTPQFADADVVSCCCCWPALSHGAQKLMPGAQVALTRFLLLPPRSWFTMKWVLKSIHHCTLVHSYTGCYPDNDWSLKCKKGGVNQEMWDIPNSFVSISTVWVWCL